jgi:hypothetical protein
MMIGCNLTNFGVTTFLLLLNCVVRGNTLARGVGDYSPLDGWVTFYKTWNFINPAERISTLAFPSLLIAKLAQSYTEMAL